MIHLMVGNNWDAELLDGFIFLNNMYRFNDIKISEIYGSLLSNPIGTARPDYRIQNKSNKYFIDFVKKANDNGININYTINIPCFGSLKDLKDKEQQFIDFLGLLEQSGVSRVTVSHPLLIDIIKQYTKLKVELSTIYEIDSILAFERLAPKIDKVCLKLAKNRDFTFIKAIKKVADEYDVSLELLANEFCYLYCVDRAQCYQLHGHTKEKNRLYNWYPMGKCINIRYQEPVEWIKAPFILPQWMEWYNRNFLINHFKITGRTHHTSYILWVTEQYMKKNYTGNLLELWSHLENIGKNEENYSAPSYSMSIAGTYLEHSSFLMDIDCDRPDCSVDCKSNCTICYDVFDKNFKKFIK